MEGIGVCGDAGCDEVTAVALWEILRIARQCDDS